MENDFIKIIYINDPNIETQIFWKILPILQNSVQYVKMNKYLQFKIKKKNSNNQKYRFIEPSEYVAVYYRTYPGNDPPFCTKRCVTKSYMYFHLSNSLTKYN